MSISMSQVPAALGALGETLRPMLTRAASDLRQAGGGTYRNLSVATDLLVSAGALARSNPARARSQLAEAARLFKAEEAICEGTLVGRDMAAYCTTGEVQSFSSAFRNEVLKVSAAISATPALATRSQMPGWVPYALGVVAVLGILTVVGGGLRAGRRRRAPPGVLR